MKRAFWFFLYRLRTWRSRIWLHWHHFNHNRVLIALSIAAAIFGVPTLIKGLHTMFSRFPDWNTDILKGAISLLVSVILIRKDFSELSRELSGIYSLEFDLREVLARVELHESYDREEWAIEKHARGSACYSKAVNTILQQKGKGILLKKIPDAFDAFERQTAIGPQAVKDAIPFILLEAFKENRILFNSPKVRLCTDLLVPDLSVREPVLSIQKTDYFSSLCTNDAVLRRLYRKGDTHEVILGELQLLTPDARSTGMNVVLAPLRQSPCSNHIGVSTIGITEDGRIIWNIQSRRSAQSANWIAPSGSGSSDLADYREGNSLQDFLIHAMERELRQECGIDGTDIGVATCVIGYARLLHRGGKPEFFGVSHIACRKGNLKISAQETSFQSRIDHTGPTDAIGGIRSDYLLSEIKAFRNEYGGAFSFLMHLNLLFLQQYLENRPEHGFFAKK